MPWLPALLRLSAILCTALVLCARAEGQKAPPKPVEPPPAAKAAAFILLKVNSGVAAVDNQEYDKAVSDLSEALRLQATNPKALLYRGRAYLGRKDLDRAIDDFSLVIKEDAKNAAAHHWRAIAYMRKGLSSNGTKLLDLALADNQRAIELEPTGSDNYQRYLSIGLVYRIKQDHDRALTAYSQAIKLQEQNGVGYARRAYVYYWKGDDDLAIEDYSTAIKLGERSETEYRFRGLCYNNKKKYDRAIADFTEAIKIAPREGALYRHRGNAWTYKNEYKRALSDFNRAIELDAGDSEALAERGGVQLALKAYDEAISDATRALAIDPKSTFALVVRGNAYRRARAYERALANYEAALKVAPDYPWAYDGCAYLWATCPEAKFRNGKKALEYVNKAVELTKGDTDDLLDTLAAVHAENGQFEEAIKYQKKAIEQLKDKSTLEEARKALKLFEMKQPFRE
jgi:tetratricopeptide (TPR) repeat protein